MVQVKTLLNHWMLQRITALILIPTFLYTLYSFIKIATCSSFHVYNFSTLLALFSTISAEIFANLKQDTSLSFFLSFQIIFAFFVLVIHIVEGIENVLNDYLHNLPLKRCLFSFIKCLGLAASKALIVYTIL